MDNKFKFTQAKLDRLTCPIDKARTYFQDEARPELLLQVTGKGAKSYYCRCWDRAKGYTARIYLGKFEQMNLIEARSRARELAALTDQGRTATIRPTSRIQEPTFSQAFESFITDPANRRKKEPRREATNYTYRKQYRCHLENKFGRRPLSGIDRVGLDEFHTRIGKENGTYAANRLVKLVSGVFNDATTKGWSGTNPAKGVEPFPERRRNRFLEEHELGPFIRSCEVESESGSRTVADVILLALFTGLRRSNVCGANWQHFDLERGTWSIPGTQMKNGESHTVYLCGYLQETLAGRYKYRTCNKWVFPSAGKTGHFVEPHRGVRRIVKRAKINPQGVSLHCLKHTFVTYADDLGLPGAVKKRLAAHTGRGDVTDGYTHAREGRVREAYEKVAKHMLEIANES